MTIEVEQKFRIDDPAVLQRRIAELGGRSADTVTQVDQYFNHPARDFAQTDEALRLRRVGEVNFITYKGPKLDATTKTRREIELPLPSGEAAATGFADLLTALGFRPVAEVRKTRRELHIEWEGQSIEVAVDEVQNVGSFIELEIVVDQRDVERAKTAIASLAAALGLSQNERRSYLELLLAQS